MNSRGGMDSWTLLFPKPGVAVISGPYLRALHLRAEAFTDSEADAHAITEKTAAFLSLFHAAEGSVGAHGTDADVKTFFDSLKVEQSGDRAILTATVRIARSPDCSTLRRSEEHTSELQSHLNIVCRLLLGKKKIKAVT